MVFTSRLSEEEKKLLEKYRSEDYDKLYNQNDESTLYKTAKTLRKVNEYPDAKIKENDIETYSNFISTKPKTGSPSASLENGYNNFLQEINKAFLREREDKEGKSFLDKAKDKTFGKPSQDDIVLNKSFLDKDFSQPSKNDIGLNSFLDKDKDKGDKSFLDKDKDKGDKSFLAGALKSASDYTLKPALRTGARVLDAPGAAISRGFYGAGAIGGAVYYQAEELKNSIVEKRDFDWLKGAEKWEDNLNVVEYVYGGKLDTGDVLDFRTRDEKRKEILKDLPMTQRKRMEDELGNIAMLSDISTSIMSGVGTSNALKALSNVGKVTKASSQTSKAAQISTKALPNAGKVATASSQTGKAAQISTKALPTVRKVATALEKTINPSLNNMAKLGAVTTALALPYYGLTGKWIFGEDRGANEGAGIVLGSLGLKGIGKAVGSGYSYINKVIGDTDFQKGVEMFNNKSKELFPESKNITEIPTDERKSIYKSISELIGQNELKKESIPNMKDTSDFHPKGDNIKKLLDKDILKEGGITLNKKGEEILGFTYTDNGKQFISKKLRAQVENGRKVGFHYPKKLWDEAINIKTEKPKIDTLKVSKTKELLKNTEVNKNSKLNTFKKNIIDEGMWDNKKSSISNYYDYIYDKTTSKFANNADRVLGNKLGDRGVTWYLGKANRNVMKQLEGTGTFGKIDRIKERVTNIQNIVGNEYDDFNIYLWAKSRYNKVVSEASKGKELLTSYVDENGKRIKMSADELKEIYKEGESKFAKLGDELHKINQEVLEYEKSVGIRTAEEVDNFIKANPYYIPDKLTMKDMEGFLNLKEFKPEKMILGKSLKGGTLDFDFSKNSVDSLYQSMQYRTRVASQIDKINTSLKHGEGDGVVRVMKKGEKLRPGEVGAVSFLNGERVTVIMPKFYKEAIEKDDALSRSLFMKLGSTPTMILKQWSTGRLAPFFQFMSPMWEIPNGLMKNISNGGKTIDYLKSMFGKGLYETDAGKRAMLGLLSDLGGDFGYMKYLKQEFDATKILENDKQFLKQSTNIKKIGKIITDKMDFGNDIELYTTRLPLFQSQLKKQGLTKDAFESFVKKAGGNGVKLQKSLEDAGYDLKGSGNVVRSLFDYTIATKTIREISRFLPYLNTSVSATTSIKRMFEDNPKAFMGYAMGVYLIADTMASHNYGKEGVLGIFEADPDKEEKMKNQNDYVKYKVGITTIDGDDVGIFELGRNVTLIEWMYPFVVESKINGEDMNTSKAFNKMFKDFTYILDLDEPTKIDFNKTPPFLKQALEVSMNKDLFYDTDLVPEDTHMEDIKTEEYTKYTKSVFIKLARWYAMMTGGELQDNGIIEGGNQMSPIKLEKLFSIVDSKGTIGKSASSIINNIEHSKGDEKENNIDLFNLLMKTYKLKTSDDRLFEQREATDYEKIVSSKIKDSIGDTKTPEELNKVGRELVEQYGDLPEFESKKRTLENAMEKQLITFEYGKDAYWEYNSTAKELASYYYSVFTEDGVDEFNKKIKNIMKMHEDGVYGDRKYKSLQEEIGKLMSE